MTRQEVLERALRLVLRLAECSEADLRDSGCEGFADECAEARLIVAASLLLLVADKEAS